MFRDTDITFKEFVSFEKDGKYLTLAVFDASGDQIAFDLDQIRKHIARLEEHNYSASLSKSVLENWPKEPVLIVYVRSAFVKMTNDVALNASRIKDEWLDGKFSAKYFRKINDIRIPFKVGYTVKEGGSLVSFCLIFTYENASLLTGDFRQNLRSTKETVYNNMTMTQTIPAVETKDK